MTRQEEYIKAKRERKNKEIAKANNKAKENVIRLYENISIAITIILFTTAFMGITIERFSYNYDGWFNTNSVYLMIIGLLVLAIPYIVFIISERNSK